MDKVCNPVGRLCFCFKKEAGILQGRKPYNRSLPWVTICSPMDFLNSFRNPVMLLVNG